MVPLVALGVPADGRGRVSDGFPRAGLPFLVDRTAMNDRGLRLRDVHEKAVRELGLLRIDPRLRLVWKGYMGAGGLGFPFEE